MFFCRELKEAKVRKFLTLKQDYMSFLDYGLKFTQQSCNALEIMKDMRSRISLFLVGLGRDSTKEGSASMLTGYVDIQGLWFMCNKLKRGS